jgi:hydrogenase expression/formation protein HypC
MCLAVPGKIISTNNDKPLLRMGRVSFNGLIKQVSLAYVPQAQIDDYVIVHAGFALSIIDKNEAQQTLEYIQRISNSAE